MARPCKTVDESRIIELASKGHTLKGIAAFCGVSYDTLHRRYADAYEKGQALLMDAIRVKQVQVTLGPKSTPADRIWAGKQFAGQTDKQDIEVRKQTVVQMVVGIAAEKLKALTDGYYQPQLPSETESMTVEPERNGPESMSDEARALPQKDKFDQMVDKVVSENANQE